ncbi:unnamed protein product [Musa banksii]
MGQQSQARPPNVITLHAPNSRKIPPPPPRININAAVRHPSYMDNPAMVVQSTLLHNPMPPPLPLDHLPRPLLGLRPLEPTSFPIEFAGELPVLLGLGNELHSVVKRVDVRPGTPDSFVDELPSDMFDYPPPPASWTSQLLARI